MSYIDAQKVKEIRNNLKSAFPEIKFSVRKDNYCAVRVIIRQSPYDFNINEEYCTVNHYWLQNSQLNHTDILKKIVEISNEGNYDNSDIMTDYFDVGWYFSLGIGEWNKPYKMVA